MTPSPTSDRVGQRTWLNEAPLDFSAERQGQQPPDPSCTPSLALFQIAVVRTSKILLLLKVGSEKGERKMVASKIKGRPRTHDWDFILGSGSRVLKHSRDFNCTIHGMIQQVRNAAARRGVKITLHADDDSIYLKVLGRKSNGKGR